MGFELEALDPVPRTFEDDEIEGQTEVIATTAPIELQMQDGELSGSTLLMATTQAAACFLRAFAQHQNSPTMTVAVLKFAEDCNHQCVIWRSEAHPELLFAHLEDTIPGDRALEWAARLLESVDVQSVAIFHSIQPSECDRYTALPLAILQTDSFKSSHENKLPLLLPPYTVTGEAAAILTRCHMSNIPAAIFVAWQLEPEFGIELLAAWEPALPLVVGGDGLDLTAAYLSQIKHHARVAEHYIYS